jgi:pyridoxal phosphate enzyme (YggS family)
VAAVIDAGAVAVRIRELRDEIVSLTDRPVQLVAVTKTFGPDAVEAALAAGADGIGENYAQELVEKLEHFRARDFPSVPWHFIGHVQRNKVRRLVDAVVLWQTIDRIELIGELARRAPGAAILLQVNATDEPQKGGCEPAAVGGLAAAARAAGLDLQGLMTIGRVDDTDATRRAYRLVRTLADDNGLDVCSMGMSDDYRIALAEGATMVRIGSRLFGPRAAR